MKTELQELNSSDSLIKEYTIVVDSLILNWDSLVAAENFQISQIKRVIERIELQPAFNKSKLIETKNSLCLVRLIGQTMGLHPNVLQQLLLTRPMVLQNLTKSQLRKMPRRNLIFLLQRLTQMLPR